jgi:tetratricopeptide (TPR) repeat protein
MYGRPDNQPRLIPKIGILLYKMKLFQMANDCLERELRLAPYYNSAYLNVLQNELKVREAERKGKNYESLRSVRYARTTTTCPIL